MDGVTPQDKRIGLSKQASIDFNIHHQFDDFVFRPCDIDAFYHQVSDQEITESSGLETNSSRLAVTVICLKGYKVAIFDGEKKLYRLLVKLLRPRELKG